MTWDLEKFTLHVRDPSARLAIPVQTNLYAGTGDDEGPEDLTGKVKPICLGSPKHLTAVLVDRTNLIYQVHDATNWGAPAAISAVYDRGESYTAAGDLPGGIANLREWTPVTSNFATDLSLGLFRLGSLPVGTVTADVTGPTAAGSTASSLIQWLAENPGGFATTELDGASFNSFATAQPAPVSFYIDSPTTILEAIDALLVPRGYRTFTEDGFFAVGRIGFANRTGTVTNPVDSIVRERVQIPRNTINLGYGRNWTPLREDDLSTSADIDADFATAQFRRVTAEDATISTRRPLAAPVELDTLWDNSVDAQNEADDLLGLLGADRDLYRVTARNVQFKFRAGQTVQLKFARFGLDNGRDFIVLGIRENTRTQQTTLSLWG
jgi:hypothetical protein